MAKFIDDLGAYLKEVLWEGLQKLFTFFDILGIVLFFFPQLAERVFENKWLARRIGVIIFVASFLFANFILYRKLKGLIDESEDAGADIRFEMEKDICELARHASHYFSHEGKRIHPCEVLYRNGLPIGVIIGAWLKGENRRDEPGELVWKIIEKEFTGPFALRDESDNGSFLSPSGEPLGRISAWQYDIAAKYELPIKVTVEDPPTFAQSLSSLGSYHIVIEYRTKRGIESYSRKKHHLTLEGDFAKLQDEICKKWKQFEEGDKLLEGFSELAQLAECQ